MVVRAPAGAWYTAVDGASPETVSALCRGALLAVRERVTTLQIDVYSDEPWPPDVMNAVRGLDEIRYAQQSRRARRRGREPDISVVLDPRDDHEVGLALAVAPFTICGTGYGDRRMLWDVNDTGTSLGFSLLPAELAAVRAYVDEHGGQAEDVVPWMTSRGAGARRGVTWWRARRSSDG
jgi:hypothetical protein